MKEVTKCSGKQVQATVPHSHKKQLRRQGGDFLFCTLSWERAIYDAAHAKLTEMTQNLRAFSKNIVIL